MIEFRNLNHQVSKRDGDAVFLSEFSADLRTSSRLALFVDGWEEKTAVLGLITGSIKPETGSVYRHALTSMVAGSKASLVPQHSMRRNCRFFARLYGVDDADLIKLIGTCGKLGEFLDEKLQDTPPDISREFRYALAYSLPFDVFVVDGDPIPPHSDAAWFRDVLNARLRDRGLICVTSNPKAALTYCEAGAVLIDGALRYFPSVEEAADAFSVTRAGELPLHNNQRKLHLARKALGRNDKFLIQLIIASEMKHESLGPGALWLSGELSMRREDWLEAAKTLCQACISSPRFSDPLVALIRVSRHVSDKRLLVVIAKILFRSEDPALERAAARLFEKLEEFELARAAWNFILAKTPSEVESYILAARFELARGRPESALHVIGSCENMIDDFRLTVVRAEALAAMNNLDELIVLLPKLASRPRHLAPFLRIVRDSGRAKEVRSLRPSKTKQLLADGQNASPLEGRPDPRLTQGRGS